jgi:hypothetical protein
MHICLNWQHAAIWKWAWLTWLSHNSFTIITIWSPREIQLVITTTHTMLPSFKSVSPVFGVRPLSMKLGWLRCALFVLAKELTLCPYLQMRFTPTISANQLVWASHSNPSIPEDREKLSGSKIKEMCKLWHIKKACKHCNYYLMYVAKVCHFQLHHFRFPRNPLAIFAGFYASSLYLISASIPQTNWCMSWKPGSTSGALPISVVLKSAHVIIHALFYGVWNTIIYTKIASWLKVFIFHTKKSQECRTNSNTENISTTSTISTGGKLN